jgi:hypothetical protein
VGIGAEGLAFDPPVHPFQAVNATPINPQILGHLLGRHSCRLAVFFQEEFVGVRASLHWNDMGALDEKRSESTSGSLRAQGPTLNSASNPCVYPTTTCPGRNKHPEQQVSTTTAVQYFGRDQ